MLRQNGRSAPLQPPPAARPRNRVNSTGSHHTRRISTPRVWVCVGVAPLHFPLAKPLLDTVIAQHWTIFAQEGRTELAVSTQANGTLHVPFHGDKDVVVCYASLLQGHNGETHHDLRPTEHGHGLRRI